jgi:predicted peptidase
MKKTSFIFLFAFCVLQFSSLIPVNLMSQQKGMSFKVEIKKGVFLESKFLLYLPEGYDKKAEKKWPLLLFLHGSGERGDWLELVKKNGPPKLIEFGKFFPFIVVSPQCPEEERWSVEVLNMLLDEMVNRFQVDENCIIVTGLSMGGEGTWNLAYAYPDRFAAIVPVCGWTDPSQAEKIKGLPVWVFHGVKDDVVPFSESEDMVNALKALGSPVKFTVYPEANHDSWTEAYESDELWDWLAMIVMGCH